MKNQDLVLTIIVFITIFVIFIVLFLLLFRRIPNVGDRCELDSYCRGGTKCDTLSKTCRFPVGAVCIRDEDCGSGVKCVNGRCKRLIPRISVVNVLDRLFPETEQDEQETEDDTTSASPAVSVTTSEIEYYEDIDPSEPSIEPVGEPTVEEVVDCRDTFYPPLYDTPDFDDDGSSGYCTSGFSDTFPSTFLTGTNTMTYGCRYSEMKGVELSDGNVVSSDDGKVIDVIGYSNSTIYLLHGGFIVRNVDGKSFNIRTNKEATAIEKHGGKIYGVCDQSLYVLDSRTFEKLDWKWIPCEWSPVGITEINSSYDGKTLWIVANGKGYRYDKDLNLKESLLTNGIVRRYGRDEHQYLDIDRERMVARYVNKTNEVKNYDNIYDAAIAHDSTIHFVSAEDSERYLRVKIIKHRPMYISR